MQLRISEKKKKERNATGRSRTFQEREEGKKEEGEGRQQYESVQESSRSSDRL